MWLCLEYLVHPLAMSGIERIYQIAFMVKSSIVMIYLLIAVYSPSPDTICYNAAEICRNNSILQNLACCLHSKAAILYSKLAGNFLENSFFFFAQTQFRFIVPATSKIIVTAVIRFNCSEVVEQVLRLHLLTVTELLLE